MNVVLYFKLLPERGNQTDNALPLSEEIYISLRNYEAEADDEMSFDAGVMLEVTEKTLDGWWYVK